MRAKQRDALLLSLKAAVDVLQVEGTIRTDHPDGSVSYSPPNDDKYPFVSGTVVGTVRVQESLDVQTDGDAWGSVEKEPLNKRAEILREAENLINGDRALTYGPPQVSFGRIADIWNAQGFRLLVPREDMPDIFQAKEISPTDVALALIGMKLSRTMGAKKHRDNWADLAGYSGLGFELADKE